MGFSHTQFGFGIGTERKGEAEEKAEEENDKPCSFCDMLKGIEAHLADMKTVK